MSLVGEEWLFDLFTRGVDFMRAVWECLAMNNLDDVIVSTVNEDNEPRMATKDSS